MGTCTTARDRTVSGWLVAALLCGCAADPADTATPPADSPPRDSADSADTSLPDRWTVRVLVTLDGSPAADTLVMQGGGQQQWTTDANGQALVDLDASVVGDLVVIAAHPDARVGGVDAEAPTDEVVEIALTRFDPADNPDYPFADPGGEDRTQSTTNQCSHCHATIHESWYASPHRKSASNRVVHDVYGGAASAFSTVDNCVIAGGVWATGREPGTGALVDRCRMGEDVLDLTGGGGACADCHAPGIDGELGGRDLLDATGVAYEAGVHCDVCHHVESVDMAAPPGVGGRLHVVRPSEPTSSPGMGAWLPLTFGPYADVLNPRMGSVQRDVFHEAELCGGCHESQQSVLVPGAEIDTARWPEGLLPVHTTYSEWQEGPMNPAAPCQTCHMPPRPDVGNSADLYNVFEDVLVGISAGWERTPGEVRDHAWWGPRQRESGMLELAATVEIESQVNGGVLTAAVTVKNVGPGHAIPTGEPLRSLVLQVEASCDGLALVATGGHAIPDFGGSFDRQEAEGDWNVWPGAVVGDVVRVVRRSGGWVDYEGYGPFGDGRFDVQEKGMPEEAVAGFSTVVALAGDRVTFDGPLPPGDVAYRGSAAILAKDGDTSRALAGAPGFAFARVLVGEDGTRMVPHFLAVDVASDNRLLPQASFTTEHTFEAPCAAPDVRAVLVHRAWPVELAKARGWALTESVMAGAGR